MNQLLTSMYYKSGNVDKFISVLQEKVDGLNDEQIDKFMLGRSFFTVPWVKAPSVTSARDGLGPLFNANSCISCHPNNGRGNLLTKDGLASRALVARLSIKANDSFEHKEFLEKKGFVPEPVYGEQLAINGIFGVDFEGQIKIDFDEEIVQFPDGKKVILQKPRYSLENLKRTNLSKEMIMKLQKSTFEITDRLVYCY